MPPVKVPKKALKSMEKPVVPKPVMGKKKTKKNYESFSIYLFKILKLSTELNMGISRKSIIIMNNFVNDTLEKLACESGRLIAHGKKTTIAEGEIRTAARILIPGELGKHALIQGEKALMHYKNSTDSQSY